MKKWKSLFESKKESLKIPIKEVKKFAIWKSIFKKAEK
jgi:hypothetical protein